MLKVEGFSVTEISRKTGLSESSVKVTAHRGYKTLRKLVVRPADGH
jgi:DNA-directed RNA polymerase specialized sigma24 family protein